MRHHRFALALLLPLLTAGGAHAQEHDVLRQTFHNFFESNLGVEVETEAGGELRVIRGADHRVEVAGRAPGGIASFGLDATGRRTLTLTAVGTDRVSFVLVVPEDVRVHLRLPGHRRTELVGSMRRSASYSWDDERRRPAGLAPPVGHVPEPPERTTIERGPPPASVSITGADRLARLTLRAEPGADFQLIGSPLTGISRGGDALVLQAVEDSELTIVVPGDVLDFLLRLDGRSAVRVRGGGLSNFCEPVVSQTLPDGSHWLTFTPSDGVACGAPSSEPPVQRS